MVLIIAIAVFAAFATPWGRGREPISRALSDLFTDPLKHLADGAPLLAKKRMSQRPVEIINAVNQQEDKPDVYILLMESLNPKFCGMSSMAGVPITPNLDRLATNSLWVKDFFGNAVFSFGGHVCTLGSVPASATTGNPYSHADFIGLPRVLATNGYETYMFLAIDTPDFTPAAVYKEKLGFEHVILMDNKVVSAGEEAFRWGWGLQDDVFYRVAFRTLISREKRRPVLAVFANASNHAPFILPESLRKHFPYPSNLQERFVDSVSFADGCLKDFYEQLRTPGLNPDRIIVVAGDHGFPLGENGNTVNIVGAEEENFRTICSIAWEGHLKPRVLNDIWSQVDLAPTILDLLRIPCPTTFVGQSMLSPNKVGGAWCAQPFDGGFLCVIRKDGALRYSLEEQRFERVRLSFLKSDINEEVKAEQELRSFAMELLQFQQQTH